MKGYNFSEPVRRMLAGAREEAAALRHEYIGTEHILLGMLREGNDTGVEILENLDVNPADLRANLLEALKPGRAGPTSGPDLPYTSRAKKVLDEAMAEAIELNHSYVGSEHLLLGLLRERMGIAGQVLDAAGVAVENARHEMLRILGTEMRRKPAFHTSAWGDTAAKAASQLPHVPQYTQRVRSVLADAYNVAKRQKAAELTSAHITIALLEHGRGTANAALDALDFRRDDALAELITLSTMGTSAVDPVDVLTLNGELSSLLQSVDGWTAHVAAPGTHHLLLAILGGSVDVAGVFATQGVSAQTFREAVDRVSG